MAGVGCPVTGRLQPHDATAFAPSHYYRPMNSDLMISIDSVCLWPEIADGRLKSLGAVTVGALPLRNAATRWLPWFDTLEGDVFRSFEFGGVRHRGDQTVIATRAVSDPDVLFRERRDCSGDPCFRNVSWDAAPLTADLAIVLEPVRETIGGRRFSGFRYWFEYTSADTAIHRLVDRQTWEVGGNLDDVTLVCRNWLTPPRYRVQRGTTYSTVGLDNWANLLPGNLWGRWSLLPGFDLQYGQGGVLLGWFDEVSLIRTVIETNAVEDWLRVVDLHAFADSRTIRTNPKTIAWCPDRLDDVDAMNLWTAMQDCEHAKACRQFAIPPEAPPALVLSQNVWQGFRFDSTYDEVVDVAAEFGLDHVYIDAVWEHGQALKETLEAMLPAATTAGTVVAKYRHSNMCTTYDFEVAAIHGGEAGLKRLCDRARAQGVGILSWMSTHYFPQTRLNEDESLRRGNAGIFAARESGRHPDTGYPAECWPANLHTPVFEKMRDQILGVCRRTGLAGFLWDSFCNLGWWQVDYSQCTLRPQYDKMAALYAAFVKAGLYITPEALVTFSAHSCCGLHGGNIYADDQLGYSYNTNISLWYGGAGYTGNLETRILRGEAPIDELFRCLAHKRVPHLSLHTVPRADWHAPSVAALKKLFAAYRQHRDRMQHRTVLPDDAGVLWESDTGPAVLFSFRDQIWQGTPVARNEIQRL